MLVEILGNGLVFIAGAKRGQGDVVEVSQDLRNRLVNNLPQLAVDYTGKKEPAKEIKAEVNDRQLKSSRTVNKTVNKKTKNRG